jgi:ribonuclease BN (tRNA processing enzyme)
MFKFISNGSAFSKNGNNSAYYKDGDTMLLIDCGESVFQDLLKKDLLSGVKNLLVLITHSHSDHCGSLSGLVWYCEYILKIVPEISASKAVFDILDLMGNHENSYSRNIVEHMDGVYCGPFHVIPFITFHQEGMDCFGYMVHIEIGEDLFSFYYSGDTKTLYPDIPTLLQKQELDAVYCDVTDYDGADNVHMNIDKLASIIPQEFRDKVHLMHFADNFNKQKAVDLGFKLTNAE